METFHYRASVLGRALTSKIWLLLAAIPFLAHADEPPLCESYTPGSLCLCEGWGFSVIGEALYWTARQNHLAITTANVGLSPTNQIPPALDRWNFRGDMIRLEPAWKFGWRVGAGFTSSCDFWDLFAYWTSYCNNDSEEVDIIDLPALNIWGYPDTLNAARLFAAKGKWDIKYNVFDFEFGRAYWIGQCLNMRPYFGARAAWIDQQLNFDFDFQPQNSIPFGVLTQIECDFSGGGLRAGFDLHFTNGTGFGLYGKVSYSLLYGTFKSNLNEIETNAQSENVLIAQTEDTFKMGTSAMQAIIGVNWSECFCCNRYRVGLHLQWEFNNWNDLGKYHHYSTSLQNGIYHQDNASLNLMGISFGGRLDF